MHTLGGIITVECRHNACPQHTGSAEPGHFEKELRPDRTGKLDPGGNFVHTQAALLHCAEIGYTGCQRAAQFLSGVRTTVVVDMRRNKDSSHVWGICYSPSRPFGQ